MKHEIDLKNFAIRTDLINENLEKITNKRGIVRTNSKKGKIEIEEVSVSKESSLKEGEYVSILFEDVSDSKNRKEVEEVFYEELKKVLEKKNLTKDKSCLIVGLGNRKSTPDALGPYVIDHVIVTRYIKEISTLDENYRETSAYAPGVFGESGIETGEIVLKLIECIHPDFLLVVDALKSGNINRVNKVIQISDTGIQPGSGIGNKRKEISEKTVGIPVLAIGVPTVIEASVIVSDTIKYLYKKLSYSKENTNKSRHKFIRERDVNYLKYENKDLTKEEKEKILGMVGTLDEEEVQKLIYEVLEPIGYNLIVTGKEIDFTIKNLSEVISKGINRALHKIQEQE